MIADALTNPPRSLAQYAEELRRKWELEASTLELMRYTDNPIVWQRQYEVTRSAYERLLAVEREINWRMGL